MRLLKTHSHTSDRLGYEARKNTKKATAGKRRRNDKGNYRKNPPSDRQHGGGARRRKAKTNTKWNVAQPAVPRGKRVPILKRTAKRRLNNIPGT